MWGFSGGFSMLHTVEGILGEDRITLETGELAAQADGAVVVRYGDTVVLVTVCIAKEPRDVDFLPLTIDFEERHYAAGKIPGGFLRREGRPSQQAILSGRLIDRPIRPLLPKVFRREIQVIATVLSADQENLPDVLAIVGASAALSISEMPFDGPVGAVRVGYLDGEFIINPTFSQLQDSLMDLVVVGTKEKVVMIEAGTKEVSEELIMQAIKLAQEANKQIIEFQENLQNACGKPKAEFVVEEINPELKAAVSSFLDGKIAPLIAKPKLERDEAFSALNKELLEKFGEEYPAQDILALFEYIAKTEVRVSILKKGIRPSGRSLREIRPIECKVGLLPRAHGSGLFSRGSTQVLNITTLGSARQEQPLDGLTSEDSKRFIHHYNFPPYSTGEVKRIGTGRREIGHGALAERALAPVIPSEKEFPYTIRLVSEALSSNGSTSMASACSSTLSLMDAGVPIKAPVSGIAMGLVTGENGEFAVLSDLEGIEDFYGDMDFKVAGTSAGITALQLDMKIKGLTFEIIESTLNQAHEGRAFIMTKMQETIASSRPELSKYAPRIVKINIDPSKIGAVIGPGGKMIKSIMEQTKVTIDVENDGTVLVGSSDEEAAQKAISMIQSLTREVEVGTIYTGKVTRLFNYGALVEFLPGKEGLVHISALADYRVPSVEDVVKVGDEIMVMVTEIDRQGKISLSRRAVFEGSSQAGEGAKVNGSSTSKHSPHRPPHDRPMPQHRRRSPSSNRRYSRPERDSAYDSDKT